MASHPPPTSSSATLVPSRAAKVSSMYRQTKRWGKKVIGYDDEAVPVVSVSHWIRGLSQDPKGDLIHYVTSLFPITSWITRYNFGWLTGDVVAGLTVGIVVVPQSMSYAQIATLPPEYGLYSAFVGVLIYCLFATSKDVSIGPVAVMSLTVSQIIDHVNKNHPNVWSGPQIATTVAFICGAIVLGIGILRLGWIVEFIPAPAVSGFMTGSAINIVAGQVPGLLGESGFDTRAATYKVIINSLKFLPQAKLDAAFGVTGLVSLYAIRMLCDWLSNKYPRRKRFFFFLSTFRNAFVIIVLTIASWLYCRHRKSHSGKYPIKILQTVPSGFQHVGAPTIDSSLVSALAPELPVATIILLLEHIAISKSFGRVNGYKINPNQELIAIGVTNLVGTCFGAYPATGSFSRSALKSKSGVRTPAAGILTAIVVIVALYGLTPAFFWIPSAGLSAIIIHAVADLVAKPRQVYSFWRVSPLEFVIWAAAVLVTVFSTIEDGIYTSICTSLALLLIRVARPRGYFLGKITLRAGAHEDAESREVYVPLNPKASLMNTSFKPTPPTPGVIVYRFEESFLYPNSSILNSTIVDHVKANMRRGVDMSQIRMSDRPWNDPGPKPGQDLEAENSKKPDLKAIVLDFSGVSQVDTTAIQALIDTRNEVERWVDHPVEFHFATVLSPWIRRALIAGGFGMGRSSSRAPTEIAQVVHLGDVRERSSSLPEKADVESPVISEEVRHGSSSSIKAADHEPGAPIVLQNTPFFHFDVVSAVRAAESGAERERDFSRSPSITSVGTGKNVDSPGIH
ncbi:sulfate permease [Phanerochaete sordida]|uniref:Sulfate permease n=1 Tax=Phanerochaete sordida TaxID=48140 RepID=A0A9P3LKB8_9APHY|nr:sulfate permease [Phanerochaete sordida]